MRRPTSACIVTGEFPPAIGGIADYTASLAHALRQRGLTVTVCTTGRHRPASGEPGLPVAEAPGWRARDLRATVATIASVRADVVHLQYQAAAYGMSSALAALPYLVRAKAGAPFVITFHDLLPPYLFPSAGPVRRWFNHALIGASDVAVFTEPADLVRSHARRPAFWVPIGSSLTPGRVVDRTAARARFGIADDDAVVATFGFLNASKGLPTLLRAAERLVRGGVPLRLLLIGDEIGASDASNRDTAAAALSLAAELGIADQITRTGYLAPDEISVAMAAADIAALPFADGASLRRSSLLACLAHRLPVVTTLPGPFPMVGRENRVAPFEDPAAYRIDASVAALVPRGDDAALAREIYRLLDNPGRRERLAAAGASLAERLSWPDIAEATVAVYARALAARG